VDIQKLFCLLLLLPGLSPSSGVVVQSIATKAIGIIFAEVNDLNIQQNLPQDLIKIFSQPTLLPKMQ
jgi:hypothetical protein